MRLLAVRRAHWVLCLVAMSVSGAVWTMGVQASAPRQNADPWLEVGQWRAAVADHTPGLIDKPLLTVGRWANADAQRVVTDIEELAGLLVDQHAKFVKTMIAPDEIDQQEDHRHFTPAQLQEILGLTDDEANRGDANRVLKRGALFYTDLAVFASSLPPQAPAQAAASSQSSALTEVIIHDGREVGREDGAQWDLARSLLDTVFPSPASDVSVRQWYISTTAYLENKRRLGQARTNVIRGLKPFSTDGSLLFYDGALHEALASPPAQNVERPAGMKAAYGDTKEELGLAEACFRQSLQWRQDSAEGHLHFGRVTGLLGHHDDAVAELTKAEAALTDPPLKYYAALFLGHEFEMLDRRDEARASFARAAALYPTAQSPLLSLSELAQRHSDAPAALQAMARVLALPAEDPPRDDPWWGYDVSHVRDANVLIGNMRSALGGPPR